MVVFGSPVTLRTIGKHNSDLVVGSGAAVVFVEYTPIPNAVFPTQVEQAYAAAKWVSEHGAEIGVDGSRIAVAGNSVGGDMSAALTLMAKDRGGPSIRLQVLLIPATDTDFETKSYRKFKSGRFLPRAFMEFGWNIYAPDESSRQGTSSQCGPASTNFAAYRPH